LSGITKKNVDFPTTGWEMHSLITELYPICRSITGEGVRETLKILKKVIPLEITEIPSGTKVFDWTIPKEWNIRDAYIKNSHGKKIVDFKKSNLHVMSYSSPVSKKIPLTELKKHLHTLEEYPEWIPYLTSYYSENWGFCVCKNDLNNFKSGSYDVVIDSSLKNGSLSYGEYYLKGRNKDEVLLSTYLCHPSLCNDNLSGVVLITHLAKILKTTKLKYSYRFLFIPETIGAIAWLSQNQQNISKIKYGLVATCVGDPGISTYKKSRDGANTIDLISQLVLEESGDAYRIVEFFPSGSDERQFCSPGFNLPVGSLMRTPYGQFPEYHTSADNLDFVTAEHLADSLKKYLDIIYIIENNAVYYNQNPKCEPQLGRRGLYRKIGSQKNSDLDEMAIFWVLNLSDGKHSLLDIAIRSKIPFRKIRQAADSLKKYDLILEER